MDSSTPITLVPVGGVATDRMVLEGDQELHVGRSSRCQLRLPQSARFVSRLHALLTPGEGVWFVTDTSRQGTFIDGRRIHAGQRFPLQHGRRIRFGECEFVVRLGVTETDSDSLGADGTYTVTLQEVDLTAIDASRVLQSALELPEHLGCVTTEMEMYTRACEYLVAALSPAIATAYTTVVNDDGSVELLGRADRPDLLEASGEIVKPTVSRRVLQRLKAAPEAVLLLQRQLEDVTFSATIPGSAHALAASLLETDPRGRPTILYAVSDRGLSAGQPLVAQYLRLVATLMRQHVLTLRRAHLTRCFSPNLVKLLVQQGGSSLIEGAPRVMCATSLFFDVRGSSLPLEASAEDLASVYKDLRRIISIVTDCVFDYEGTIIDYAGDGVFAAWGVPLPQADQATRAVRCAMEVLERLGHERFQSLTTKRTLCGIGIAKGDVLAGAVGSSAVLKFGILGPSVNAAQRLAMLTKADELDRPILMTGAVNLDAASADLPTRSLGSHALLGMSSRVEVFEPLFSSYDVDTRAGQGGDP